MQDANSQNMTITDQASAIDFITATVKAHLPVLTTSDDYDKRDGLDSDGNALETVNGLATVLQDSLVGAYDITAKHIDDIMRAHIPAELF